MSQSIESSIRRKWFTVGVAISLSAGTFASPLGTSMDQPWHHDAKGNVVPIDYALGVDSNESVNFSGRLKRTPWSGPWWPTRAGSIAIRWQTSLYWNSARTAKFWPDADRSDVMTYRPYSADELADMTEEEIGEKLSAVEKLDVIAGRADAVALGSVVGKNGYYANLAEVRRWSQDLIDTDQEEMGFHGLCHGFAHASMWLPEPARVSIPATYILSNGQERTINVSFYNGDLKGLASYFYGRRTFHESEYQAAFIGSNNRGMNPAALHLLLTNLVWKSSVGFVTDIYAGDQIWNYPVIAFRTTTYQTRRSLPSDAASSAVKQIEVVTDVDFQKETNPKMNPEPGRVLSRRYEYYLEIDAKDRIVGGSWLPNSDRPDYSWILTGKIPFDGDYARLNQYWSGTDTPEPI